MKSALPIALALLLFGAPVRAEEGGLTGQQASRLLLDANRALQAGNAARFLSYFAASQFSAYSRLENHVVPLTAQTDIASSIDVLELVKRSDGYDAKIDWVLQLTPASGFGEVVQRREEISVHIRATGGKIQIHDLHPVEFFRPL